MLSRVLAVALFFASPLAYALDEPSELVSRDPKNVKYIAPGGIWLDTDGKPIHAHAGGIAKEGDRWYWVGQDEREDAPLNSGFNIYSSSDLVTWKNHGQALSPIEGHPTIGPEHVAERPKLVYSNSLKQWALWWHSDNSTYGWLNQAVAVSPNITGPYTFVNAFKPLGDDSQDFGLFLDDDGQAYALYSNGDSRAGRDNKITRMNSNFTGLTETVYTFNDIDLEAPAIIRTEQSYYILMSHKTGYRPNNVVAYRARSLSGPWSQPIPIAPPGTRTFSSQSTFNIRIKGSKKTTIIYAGDSWATTGTGTELQDSRYIWLPTTIDEKKGTVSIEWHDVWAIDVKTGEWWAPKGTTYEAEDGVVKGSAWVQECGVCSNNKIVTGISGDNSTVTINNIQGTGSPQWISFYYINPDDLGFGDSPGGTPDRIGGVWKLRRFATVSVNGAAPVQMRQRDSNKGVILSVPLQVTLRRGKNNSITIGGFNGTAADLDKIVVYE